MKNPLDSIERSHVAKEVYAKVRYYLVARGAWVSSSPMLCRILGEALSDTYEPVKMHPSSVCLKALKENFCPEHPVWGFIKETV